MTPLVLLRHAPTDWNARGIIQGRTDVPLDAAGRTVAQGWRVPTAFAGFDWLSSPLVRAVETARLLSGGEPAIEPRLIETDWGDWEGDSLDRLRAESGERLAVLERRGLDFHAPGGESPRQVQERLRPFLAARAALGRPAIGVCHKGVIRAVYALAAGWDMRGRPSTRLRDGTCQAFRLDPDGRPRIDRLNIPLSES